MAEKKFSDLTAKAATIADTDLVAISESAGGGTYTSKSVTGANIKALVTDANMTTTDITTNDVSTSKHGFAPKAPNDTTKFLRGDGTWAVPAAGGLTKFTEAENTSAPNGTVYVDSLTAAASSTNADAVIRPKGNGAFILAIPDNTTTGGNKRGQYAVDLSLGTRAGASSVASGNYSFAAGSSPYANSDYAIAIGATASNTRACALNQGNSSGIRSFSHGDRASASGTGSVAFNGNSGGDSIASGDYSFSFGVVSTASGNRSVALGGTGNVASGLMSYAMGDNANTFSIYGRHSRGAYNSATGDCQKSEFFLSVRTTGNTATTVTVNGVTASSTNQVILSNQSAYRFKGTIIGKQSGSTNVAAWDVDGLIVRGANAAATTLVVSNVNVVDNTPTFGTPTLAADTTNGGLRVQVTGVAATNIQWTCTIETTEVIYA